MYVEFYSNKLTPLIFLASILFTNLRGQTKDCSQPGVIFCSGFEEGNKSIWDDLDGNPDSTNLIMEDPGPFNVAGNHIMRLRVPKGRGGADLVKVLPSQYDKLYALWFQKWEPGYKFSAPCHGGGLHAGDRNLLGRSDYRPTGADWFCTWIEPYQGHLNLYSYYLGMYMNCADPNGQCWGDQFPCTADEGQVFCEKAKDRDQPGKVPPIMETGRWYCLEIMLDAGAAVNQDSIANGVQDFWIDGIEYGPFTGLWHRTSASLKIGILWITLFHHDSTHSVEGIMVDDVEVSRQRIGPTMVLKNPQFSLKQENVTKGRCTDPFFFNLRGMRLTGQNASSRKNMVLIHKSDDRELVKKSVILKN
jgi:hypothetical protein